LSALRAVVSAATKIRNPHALTATKAIKEITDWMMAVSRTRIAREIGRKVSDQ